MAVVGWILGVVVTAAAAVGAVTVATRSCPGPAVAMLQLVLPWTTVLAAVTATVSALTSTWPLAVGAAVVTVASVLILRPRFRPSPSRPASGEPCVSVALANLFLDNESSTEAMRQLVAEGPDVIVLTELTDELLATFDEVAGDAYPQRVHPEPLDGEYEPGIFVADHVEVGGLSIRTTGPLRTLEALVRVDGHELLVITLHPVAPTGRSEFRQWTSELAALRRRLGETTGPTIALGDFNGGTLQAPYELVAHGLRFRDAHDEQGVALKPSWGMAPGLPRWVPTVVARLDHLLISPEIVVHDLDDLDPVGSDHRPFLARLGVAPAQP